MLNVNRPDALKSGSYLSIHDGHSIIKPNSSIASDDMIREVVVPVIDHGHKYILMILIFNRDIKSGIHESCGSCGSTNRHGEDE